MFMTSTINQIIDIFNWKQKKSQQNILIKNAISAKHPSNHQFRDKDKFEVPINHCTIIQFFFLKDHVQAIVECYIFVCNAWYFVKWRNLYK